MWVKGCVQSLAPAFKRKRNAFLPFHWVEFWNVQPSILIDEDETNILGIIDQQARNNLGSQYCKVINSSLACLFSIWYVSKK